MKLYAFSHKNQQEKKRVLTALIVISYTSFVLMFYGYRFLIRRNNSHNRYDTAHSASGYICVPKCSQYHIRNVISNRFLLCHEQPLFIMRHISERVQL
jgi:hypothetical protein